jgi:predicted lipoprotein with Yx(FWY)xxD motif
MPRRRPAIFLAAIPLAGFFGIGAGAAAGTAGAASAATAYGTPPTPASPAVTPSASVHLQSVTARTVHTATAAVSGRTESILVDAQGLPLYFYQADTAKKSLVNGELARLWPALVSAKSTGAVAGARGKLTSLPAANGRQVAYNGHFLYTFVDDSPGHVTGQGVSNFFVATPRLKSIISPSTVATPVTTSRGGY